MNRFLTKTTAMALGLALSGLAKADVRTNQHGFERNRNSHCDTHGLPVYWDSLHYFDPSPWPYYWDGLRNFDHRWYDPDLRHFDDYWRVNPYCFHHGHRSTRLAMSKGVKS